jgi:hypothetical protein
MSQKKLDPSAADLIASANESLRWKQRLIESQTQEVPKGWKTRENVEKILELRKSQTLAWLRKAIANNICEKKYFIIIEHGRRIEKPHYFLK